MSRVLTVRPCGSSFLGPLDRDYSRLSTVRQYRGYKEGPTRQVEGFDTETEDGYARIAATSEGYMDIASIEDVFAFLTQRQHRNKFNLFYNISFDFEVLFKHEQSILEQFSVKNTASYGPWVLRMIPRKFFSIRDKHRNTWTYYDIAQFYHASLKEASEKFLCLSAHELKGDRARLFELYDRDRIGEYCQHDAMLTRKLGEHYLETLLKLGLKPRRLLSAGYVAGQYMLRNADLPRLEDQPRIVNELYWKSFSGGWFDTYKRGSMTVNHYDLKSAYPAQLYNLPDTRCGKWQPGHKKGALLGIYKCTFSRSPKDFLPVGGDYRGVRIYPAVDSLAYAYLSLKEYEAYRKEYGLKVEYGYSFMPDGEVLYPYRPLIDRLFQLKEASADTPGFYQSVKETINSLYGKSAERREQKDKTIIGQLFNPVYAAETTSRVRAVIFDTFRDVSDRVVSIMTDGVMVETPHRLTCTGGLGGWELKKENANVLLLQTGVYQYGSKAATTRGFSRLSDLYKICRTDARTLTVTQTRPWHFKECLRQRRFEDVGVFATVEKEIDLNDDRKRLWPEKIMHARELLRGQFDSIPLPLSLLPPTTPG